MARQVQVVVRAFARVAVVPPPAALESTKVLKSKNMNTDTLRDNIVGLQEKTLVQQIAVAFD